VMKNGVELKFVGLERSITIICEVLKAIGGVS
jgi:hypothetical protein